MAAGLAFLFPGEASHKVGMGLDLYMRFPAVRDTLQEAEDLFGLPIEQLCFRGPASELQQTEHGQPAVFALSVAVLRLLAHFQVAPSAAAGHSLGQYTALVAAGALSFPHACRLVRVRSRLMKEICQRVPGAMVTLVGLPLERVNAICRESQEVGIVRIANYNLPDQFVVSGETTAINYLAACAARAGAVKTTFLPVSGAFHSPLMQAAQGQFASFLESIPIQPPRIPVVIDTTGASTTSSDVIRACLIEQVTAPVLWTDAMQFLLQQGMTTFVEVGPGKRLTRLVRAAAGSKAIFAYHTSTAKSLNRMLRSLGVCSTTS
jgi:[acyl-carrier-protein] S-malonyltransferase